MSCDSVLEAAANMSLEGVSPRAEELNWEEHIMATAILASMRSRDPKLRVGACVIKDCKIVSIGYNGFPENCSEDFFPWAKEPNSLLNKRLYVCHAELNAIMNRKGLDLTGCSMYVTLFPCNECAKLIIQSGIKEVVYLGKKQNNNTSDQAAEIMMKSAGVKLRKYIPRLNKLEIDFRSPVEK